MEHTGNCCNNEVRSDSGLLGELKSGEREQILKITGADCSDEVNAIKRSLAKVGITAVQVNLVSSTVTVRSSETIDPSIIRKAIEKTGVKVVDSDHSGFFATNKQRIVFVSSSGLLLFVGLSLEWSKTDGSLSLVSFVLATLLAGILVFPKALRAIKQKSLDMNVLMSVAVVGAFAIREYSEGATVVFLFSLAELLEAFSVDRARQAIRSVLKLTPQVAHVQQGNSQTDLPVSEVSPGDKVVVREGENIPLDGEVISGQSTVNQAPLTGESVPVGKKAGDIVFAGTLNQNGALTIKVTKAFSDTKISRVIKLIEEAQEEKAPAERFVDRFAKIYTPVVFILAILVAVIPPLFSGAPFELWFYRALVLLVIACPCALVLATPISVVSGLASLARRGVLVKGGKYLEALGKIRALALDKTGTLTEGKFSVVNFQGYGLDEYKVLRIAASLESMSNHPLAHAIIEFAKKADLSPAAVHEYTAIPGRGAQAWLDSHLYFVGNHRLAHELGVCTPELESQLAKFEEASLSVVVVGHMPHDDHKGEVLGVFGLGDRLKQNAKEAIGDLHSAGVRKIVVLSGDNQRTVDAICKQTGIDQGIGDLLPENKVEEVKKLNTEFLYVAMVGDGVNDAPALANATVGISMGAAGTDVAIETSDVSLMRDDLSQLAVAIRQGKRVLNVIRFNVGFALATKAIFLILALVGISNLWLAVAADMGASLLVTANALRLLRTNESEGL